MTYFLRVLLTFGGLLAQTAAAQTPLGQPTLDEQKVQIWCATTRFVYDDTGRPNLKSKLGCGGSIKEFENSIKSDSQRVYSALYQPLEVRGVMYKGLGSNASRLQTLVREIIGRLRASPARKGNAARLAGVTQLENSLRNYVEKGTPIGDLPAAETALTETADTTLIDDVIAPGDAGLAEAGISPATVADTGAGENLINKFFGPLALIMALLSLVLYVLLKRSIGASWREINARLDKRRDDTTAPQSSLGSIGQAAATFSSGQLRELEQLVQQRVEQELQKRQPKPEAVAPVPVAVAVVPPVVAPAPAPVVPPMAPLVAPEFPVTVAPKTALEATQNDLENLLPPVQLSPAPQHAPAQLRTRYMKVPVNGAFNEYDFSDEPRHDSVYEIYQDPQWPELATFSVITDPAMHTYIIQSAPNSLREACTYQMPAALVTRIVTEEEGVLRRADDSWQIEQKAAIRFE